MATEYKEIILDALTGEIIERPYTEKEIKEAKSIDAAIKAKYQKEENIRLSKLAILEKLGLTEDEAKLLLG